MNKKKNIRFSPGCGVISATVVLALIAIVLSVTVLVGPSRAIDTVSELFQSRLFGRTKTTASAAVLSEVKNLLRLNTVEFYYKTVFPYDFIPPRDYWPPLLDKYKQGIELSAKEQDWLEVYFLAEEAGLTSGSGKYEFAVLEARVQAGFTFAAEPLSPSEFIRVENDRLYLRLPQAEITNIVIVDPRSSSYPYPDISVSPEMWRKISTFVRQQLEQQAVKEEILELAEAKGKEFLRRVLSEGPWKEVSFIQ